MRIQIYEAFRSLRDKKGKAYCPRWHFWKSLTEWEVPLFFRNFQEVKTGKIFVFSSRRSRVRLLKWEIFNNRKSRVVFASQFFRNSISTFYVNSFIILFTLIINVNIKKSSHLRKWFFTFLKLPNLRNIEWFWLLIFETKTSFLFITITRKR